MNTLEIRIELSDELIQECLWSSLTPDAVVIQRALNAALDEQQRLLDVSLDDYKLTGLSVTRDNDILYAELSYTRSS